jgi:PAS domain S-box-containing protein
MPGFEGGGSYGCKDLEQLEGHWMDTSERLGLATALYSRQDLVVEHWYKAIMQTSYVSFDSAQIRAYLADWTAQIIDLLTAEPFDRDRAVAIGTALANLHYLQPEALDHTQVILARQLVAGLSPEQIVAVQPNLGSLLAGVASGFYSQARQIILAEQEETRSALVTELTRTANALQEARDHLELRVQQRTNDLAMVNAELLTEIAERERVEQALRASEERYRTVSEVVSDYAYSARIEPDGTLVPEWATEAHSRITGYVFEEMAANGEWRRLIHPEDWPIASQHYQRHVTGVPGVSEYRVITKSGQVRWVRDYSQPVWDTVEGRVVRVYGAVQDITERKQIEELKDSLIRDVSHELRTPLAKLQMGLDLLHETLEKEVIDRQRAVRMGDMVRGNVRRLLQTVEVMLDLSLLESGRIVYDMSEIYVEKLIADVILDMRPLASAKGLDLVADLPAGLPLITGDRDKLFRVLTNLLDNAIKFTEEGTITLSVKKRPDTLEIAVSDLGLGVLPENLERIFERFFQEKTRFHGVGIGLALCKAIVEAHNGSIWAESQGRGLGTTIRFTIPIELA